MGSLKLATVIAGAIDDATSHDDNLDASSY